MNHVEDAVIAFLRVRIDVLWEMTIGTRYLVRWSKRTGLFLWRLWLDQGWLDKDSKYYYDTKIGIGKKIFAGLLNKILKPKFEKMFAEGAKQIYKRYMKLESLNFETR